MGWAARLLPAIRGYLDTLQCETEGLSEVRARWDAELPPAPVTTVALPAQRTSPLVHLDAALAAAAPHDRDGLSALIGAAADHLHWVTYDAYPRAEIGEAFATGHAFAELAGPEGAPVPTRDFCAGLFLIAPHVVYRDHRHLAPELYVPLTGPTGWRFAPGGWEARAAHEPVWNPANRVHATQVEATPLLCLYVWTRDVQWPAEVVHAAGRGEIEGNP